MEIYIIVIECGGCSVRKLFVLRELAIDVALAQWIMLTDEEKTNTSIKVYSSEIECIKKIGKVDNLIFSSLVFDVNLFEVIKHSFNPSSYKQFIQGYSVTKEKNLYRLYFNFNFVKTFKTLENIEDYFNNK